MNTEINEINNAKSYVSKSNALRPNSSNNAFAKLAEQSKAIASTKPEPVKEGDRGHKISAAQIGVPKKPVSVKVGDRSYNTLCDALRAHGFNVQGDWIKARKLLKTGPAAMPLLDGTIVTFEIIL
jgi:hypothetical protein